MKIEAIIDRIEGEFAVLEIDEGEFINAPRENFPNAKEGDTVIIEIAKSGR